MRNNNSFHYKVVYGLFDRKCNLESAVDKLKVRGFLNSDISALLPSVSSYQDFAHERSTKAPEGATAGIVTGAALGGTFGWLVGIGTIVLPGLGSLVAAGPILASLIGVSVGGTMGGVTGAYIGYGIPEYVAKRYEAAMKQGGMLLSIHADDASYVDKAKQILKDFGARDISISKEAKSPSSNPKESKNGNVNETSLISRYF